MPRGHALLTGALGGLGSAIADALCRENIPVICCDRRAQDAEGWLSQRQSNARDLITFYPLDVTKEDEVAQLARHLAERDIHVSYLINNAGIQGAAAPWALESRIWEVVLRVNIHGTFYFTRAFSHAMAAAGFGRIVNLASVYAYHPGPGQAAYAAAKSAITGYTRSTAADLAKNGVTVNAIAPGLIWHERLEGVLADEVFAEMRRSTPAGREGKPEEIAATVMFLLSDGAAYITGQTIHVNGGAYMPG